MTTASAAILFASLGTVLAIRHFPLLVLLDMPAAAEPMDSIFAKAEPALRYHMDEAGVSAETQKKIYEQGIVSLRTFAGLEEDRKAVRQVLQSDFGLDPSGNLALRSDIALLLCVWESARTQLSVQEKNRQESKLGMQQRIVQPSDYATMRSAVEAKHGRLKDREAPSKGMIASKLEQVEDGAPIAEDLREVTSFADSEVEAYNAIIDPSMGFLRIRPGKTTTTPPATPEELRLRHRRIGLAWDFVKARHSTRAWLPTSPVDTFRKLSDYVLGASVAGLRTSDQRSPTWSLVLTYELELRKAAYRFVRDGECACIDTAIEKAMDSPKLLTEHFVVPFTLGKSLSLTNVGSANDKANDKGGKLMPSWDRQWGKASKTLEGKPICFKYQKGKCPNKSCRFAHVCQRCFGRHSFSQCNFKKELGHGRAPEQAAS